MYSFPLHLAFSPCVGFRLTEREKYQSIMGLCKMRNVLLLLPYLVSYAASTNTFRVIHNDMDPAVFGTTGGARLIATAGEGHVDTLTICLRFQASQVKHILIDIFCASHLGAFNQPLFFNRVCPKGVPKTNCRNLC